MNSLGRWAGVLANSFSPSPGSPPFPTGLYEATVLGAAALGSLAGLRAQRGVNARQIAGMLDGLLAGCAVVLILGGAVG